MLSARLKVFLIHLMISGLVMLGCVVLIRQFLLPPPHFTINGGWEWLKIFTPTFFVPVLFTLLVYHPNKDKKHLQQDLSVIAFLQIVILGFGLWIVYTQRTIVETLTPFGNFGSPTWPEIQQFSRSGNIYDIKALNRKNLDPVPIYISVTDKSKMQSFNNEFRLEKYLSLFEPSIKDEIVHIAESAKKRLEEDASDKQAIVNFSEQHPGNHYYIPIYGKYGKAIKVIDEQLMPVTYLNVRRYSRLTSE